jgi:hypothetical protein
MLASNVMLIFKSQVFSWAERFRISVMAADRGGPVEIQRICHRSKLVNLMNNVTRMFIPSSRRAISTALRPAIRRQHLPHPQKTFVRGATVVPGIFPIHKLPLLTFLRHQSVTPKSAEIEDARPQIKPRYKIIYTCGV